MTESEKAYQYFVISVPENEEQAKAYFWARKALQPTLTPPPASRDLISRSALLEGETEPEITTGSDSELAEHMEWDRWVDKIKRAPAVDKEEKADA